MEYGITSHLITDGYKTFNYWYDTYKIDPLATFLREGANFDVVKGTKVVGGKTVIFAVKSLRLPNNHDSSFADGHHRTLSLIQPLLRDILVMSGLKDSPYILDLYDHGSWSDPTRGAVSFQIVELSTEGSLEIFLQIGTFTKIDDDLANFMELQYLVHDYNLRKTLLTDIALGLHALHQNNIIHTDLKSENVLVFWSAESGYHAKLSDFGSAVLKNFMLTDSESLLNRQVIGTEGFRAPEYQETFASNLADVSSAKLKKLDLWAFAIVMLELLSSCRVREAQASIQGFTDLFKRLYRNPYLKSDDGEEFIMAGIVNVCLQPEPARCDDMSEVLLFLGREEPYDSSSNVNISTSHNGNPLLVQSSKSLFTRLRSFEYYLKNTPGQKIPNFEPGKWMRVA